MIDQLKKILRDNKEDIAFIIGNGIHYQYKDCHISWKELLESLWSEYVGTGIEIPKGVSFTEFYDILEMSSYDPRSCYYQGSNLKAKIKDLKGLDSHSLINCINYSNNKAFNIKDINGESLKSFFDEYQRFISACRQWCEDNVDNAEMLTDNKCIQMLTDALTNNTKLQIHKGSVKQSVAKKFQPKNEYRMSKCVEGISKLNAPILTTNFDTYISDSLRLERYILSPKAGQYRFTYFYPWNVYYGNRKLLNPLDGFGIWHINGMTAYPKSIRLGLSDYMGCVERARKMIQGDNLNEYFTGKNQSYWAGYNTWIHIVFNKPLFIFGLSLEENEVFLRWLLIQRAKYCRMYNKPFKGWFVTGQEESQGKQFFLKHLGFEVIKISDYNILYQVLENYNEV